MKNAAKYAVLALGPIALIVGVLMVRGGGDSPVADSVLFYNVLTGESERIGMDDFGVSVLKDDEGRKVRFIVVGEDGGPARAGEPMFLKPSLRALFDKMLEEGELDSGDVRVDPDTYQITE